MVASATIFRAAATLVIVASLSLWHGRRAPHAAAGATAFVALVAFVLTGGSITQTVPATVAAAAGAGVGAAVVRCAVRVGPTAPPGERPSDHPEEDVRRLIRVGKYMSVAVVAAASVALCAGDAVWTDPYPCVALASPFLLPTLIATSWTSALRPRGHERVAVTRFCTRLLVSTAGAWAVVATFDVLGGRLHAGSVRELTCVRAFARDVAVLVPTVAAGTLAVYVARAATARAGAW